jgi:hypothetical protein
MVGIIEVRDTRGASVSGARCAVYESQRLVETKLTGSDGRCAYVRNASMEVPAFVVVSRGISTATPALVRFGPAAGVSGITAVSLDAPSIDVRVVLAARGETLDGRECTFELRAAENSAIGFRSGRARLGAEATVLPGGRYGYVVELDGHRFAGEVMLAPPETRIELGGRDSSAVRIHRGVNPLERRITLLLETESESRTIEIAPYVDMFDIPVVSGTVVSGRIGDRLRHVATLTGAGAREEVYLPVLDEGTGTTRIDVTGLTAGEQLYTSVGNGLGMRRTVATDGRVELEYDVSRGFNWSARLDSGEALCLWTPPGKSWSLSASDLLRRSLRFVPSPTELRTGRWRWQCVESDTHVYRSGPVVLRADGRWGIPTDQNGLLRSDRDGRRLVIEPGRRSNDSDRWIDDPRIRATTEGGDPVEGTYILYSDLLSAIDLEHFKDRYVLDEGLVLNGALQPKIASLGPVRVRLEVTERGGRRWHGTTTTAVGESSVSLKPTVSD